MITELTKEQEALLPVYRDKWIAIGLSTEPANKELAEQGVDMAYKAAGLEPPKQKMWVPSPMAGAAELKKLGVTATPIYGQHDADYLGFYEFFIDQFGIGGQLAGLIQVAKNAGWWWAFDTMAIISDRPKRLQRDDRNRLHCETGYAIEYRDGTGVACWHGTRIPVEWVTTPKEKLDASLALTHNNIEQRRAFAEIIGWKRVLDQLKPKTIQKHKDPEIGELLEVDLPEVGLCRFLRVMCGTKREFVLPVPREMKSAKEANAWTYGLSVKTFKPEVRT